MRESAFIIMVVAMIAILIFFTLLTGNRWPSPGFIALLLACWLVVSLGRPKR
jgi:hypothetical protein